MAASTALQKSKVKTIEYNRFQLLVADVLEDYCSLVHSQLLSLNHERIFINHLFKKIMPLIKVQTSVAPPDKSVIEGMLKSLSAKLSKHLGKPESYVMTAFEPEVAMTFAGTSDAPVCYIEIKNVGSLTSSQTNSMSKDFCQQINDTLGVPQNRIYICFGDAKGSMWGWNGSTFG